MAHHHQPAHLLARWASADAFRLVSGAPARVQKIDLDLLANRARYRKWPLCLLRKCEVGARRWTRATVETAFCIPRANTLPNFATPLERVCAWFMHAPPNHIAQLPSTITHTELLKLQDRYCELRLDYPEGVLADRLDRPVAGVFEQLRQSGRITAAQHGVLRSYLSLLRFRGPSWRAHHLLAMTGDVDHAGRLEFISGMRRYCAEVDAVQIADAYDRVIERTIYLKVLAMMARDGEDYLAKHGARVSLLISDTEVPFILGDNPSRAYSFDDFHRDDFHRGVGVMPGMSDPNVGFYYPISPWRCLAIQRRPGRVSKIRNTRVSGDVVRRLNTATLLFAHDEVLFPTPCQDVFLPGVSVADSVPWQEPVG